MRSNGQSYAKKSQSKVNVKNNHALTFLGMIVFLCLAKKKKRPLKCTLLSFSFHLVS